ncbi:MAG: amino acid ABC transporter ATP-binding protein, partial [Clostridia bacterium]|nr:amino acid ABC transporter ATP-binding protein [Clostridia bacterium]
MIELKNINKDNNGRYVLKDVNLTINDGDVIA